MKPGYLNNEMKNSSKIRCRRYIVEKKRGQKCKNLQLTIAIKIVKKKMFYKECLQESIMRGLGE